MSISNGFLNYIVITRRLLPASSILLRDITAFGIEDEPQKPKVSQSFFYLYLGKDQIEKQCLSALVYVEG